MRHGWTIFTGAKPTKINTKNLNSIEQGEKLFSRYCSRCHGPGKKGPDPKSLGFDLNKSKSPSKNSAHYYLVFQINQGKVEMPSWKEVLTQKEIWDLSNYIQSIREN